MAIAKLDIDYLSEKNSLTKLYIADLSNYGNTTISTPTIEITAPGFDKVAVSFTPNNVNIFTSCDLNIGCDEELVLPDGPYTIKYTIAPAIKFYVEKTFMRTNAIKCKYMRVFLSQMNNFCCSLKNESQLREELREAKELIEGSIASANQCDFETANKQYTIANKILDRLQNCNC